MFPLSSEIFASVQVPVFGSKIYRSLKQLADGPDPPNKYNFSLIDAIVMPALGEGGGETTLTSLQHKLSVSSIYKSFNLLVPSHPPNIYRFRFIIADE
jgi:hypothetical protein